MGEGVYLLSGLFSGYFGHVVSYGVFEDSRWSGRLGIARYTVFGPIGLADLGIGIGIEGNPAPYAAPTAKRP